MSLQNRIAQFKKMAEADPSNELAHFSLGKAYMEGKHYDEAVAAFQCVLELNPGFSRAYHHLAEVQIAAGDDAAAIATLTGGYSIADDNGDLMPRNAMGDLLKQLGQPVPETAQKAEAVATAVAPEPSTGFRCSRCSRSESPLPERPFKGDLGQRILDRVCAACWNEWIHMGTKVINELQLDLSDAQSQAMYDQHMTEFLKLD